MNGVFKKISFSNLGQPFLEYILDDKVLTENINLGNNVAFEFDFDKRFCTGWYNIETKESSACSDSKTGEEQCYHCMQRSGFNPAFYNADSVSPQQEIRNQEPHSLYAAYFGGDFVKIGITHHNRDLARLLEQGALVAIILDEMPTALVARNYEAKISALNGFVESVRINKKIDLLHEVFDFEKASDKLFAAVDKINDELKTNFPKKVLRLDDYYSKQQRPITFIDNLDNNLRKRFSGKLMTLVGSLMIIDNPNGTFLIDSKTLGGHKFTMSDKIFNMDLPAQQLGLF